MEVVAYMSNYFVSTVEHYLDKLGIYLDKLNVSS